MFFKIEYYFYHMITITCKIPHELNAFLKATAREQHVSKSVVVRKALKEVLLHKRRRAKPSIYDLVKDLAGTIHGPSDLSTNPKYMEGFGE